MENVEKTYSRKGCLNSLSKWGFVKQKTFLKSLKKCSFAMQGQSTHREKRKYAQMISMPLKGCLNRSVAVHIHIQQTHNSLSAVSDGMDLFALLLI